MGMGMADADDSMPTIKIHVLGIVLVPNPGAFGMGDGDIVDGVNVKSFHDAL
jgi:hypothetical protein